MIFVKILAPGFYARQDVSTPVRIGILTLVATQLMNLALVVPLKHAGLALAIGLGACLNAFLLYRGLRRREIFQPQPGWGGFCARVAVAVVAMVAALALSAPDARWWLAAPAASRAAALAGLVALGTAAYAASLLLLGFRLRQFSRKALE
jgi:putative peptidoglycan lipid II flippase